ncbi:ent-kaurene oxidase [Colletotrichum filicis]|nr:ent-kaurene oxidase [Colletotrichum filicis]
MAAVHTTTDLFAQTLFDIIGHPQIIPALRQEIVMIISQDGWEKTALYKLRLTDSVIKESQRIKPPNVTSVKNIVDTGIDIEQFLTIRTFVGLIGLTI